MTNLKPCPFCGGKADIYEHEQDLNGAFSIDVFQAYCTECGIEKSDYENKADCIDNWNTRASPIVKLPINCKGHAITVKEFNEVMEQAGIKVVRK